MYEIDGAARFTMNASLFLDLDADIILYILAEFLYTTEIARFDQALVNKGLRHTYLALLQEQNADGTAKYLLSFCDRLSHDAIFNRGIDSLLGESRKSGINHWVWRMNRQIGCYSAPIIYDSYGYPASVLHLVHQTVTRLIISDLRKVYETNCTDYPRLKYITVDMKYGVLDYHLALLPRNFPSGKFGEMITSLTLICLTVHETDFQTMAIAMPCLTDLQIRGKNDDDITAPSDSLLACLLRAPFHRLTRFEWSDCPCYRSCYYSHFKRELHKIEDDHHEGQPILTLGLTILKLPLRCLLYTVKAILAQRIWLHCQQGHQHQQEQQQATPLLPYILQKMTLSDHHDRSDDARDRKTIKELQKLLNGIADCFLTSDPGPNSRCQLKRFHDSRCNNHLSYEKILQIPSLEILKLSILRLPNPTNWIEGMKTMSANLKILHLQGFYYSETSSVFIPAPSFLACMEKKLMKVTLYGLKVDINFMIHLRVCCNLHYLAIGEVEFVSSLGNQFTKNNTSFMDTMMSFTSPKLHTFILEGIHNPFAWNPGLKMLLVNLPALRELSIIDGIGTTKMNSERFYVYALKRKKQHTTPDDSDDEEEIDNEYGDPVMKDATAGKLLWQILHEHGGHLRSFGFNYWSTLDYPGLVDFITYNRHRQLQTNNCPLQLHFYGCKKNNMVEQSLKFLRENKLVHFKIYPIFHTDDGILDSYPLANFSDY